jgi:hypothetical protein
MGEEARCVWVRWPLFISTLPLALFLTVAMAGCLLSQVPEARSALQIRNPVPPGEEFASVNRVSRWPGDWIAYHRGGLMAFATFSDVADSDPLTNHRESPALQPLRPFGFNIYSRPGL